VKSDQYLDIYFVRHAVTPTTGKELPGRRLGLHLSEAGLAEASRCAGYFRDLKDSGTIISSIYSSPLERAVETAKEISKAIGVRVKINQKFIECDFGVMTGKLISDLSKTLDWKKLHAWPSIWRFEKGESFFDLYYRLQLGLESLLKKHGGQSIVVVSHADPIKICLAGALSMSLDDFFKIEVSTASISLVKYPTNDNMSKPKVMFINYKAKKDK
jgi:broad specificity phosphatase PhoE